SEDDDELFGFLATILFIMQLIFKNSLLFFHHCNWCYPYIYVSLKLLAHNRDTKDYVIPEWIGHPWKEDNFSSHAKEIGVEGIIKFSFKRLEPTALETQQA
ncbi:hypothetical protein ACJX0J_029588, partial [Zea mays]